MKTEQLCFSCAFWKDKIDNPPDNRQIIGGEHYTVHPWVDSKFGFMGHGGQEFYIRANNGQICKSNNVWFQGHVPERFRDLLPDTASFITKRAFKQIKKRNGEMCRAKGCWDRYNCYWYNLSIERLSGPWNVIPLSHKVGDEECESFINKHGIYE